MDDRSRETNKHRISDDIYAKSKGAVKASNPPEMSSNKYLSSGRSSSTKNKVQFPLDDINTILSDLVPNTPHGIAQTVQNASPFRNNAQYTAETIAHMKRRAEKGFTMFGMDTEWLGGGTAGRAMPVELGMIPMHMVNGKLEPIDASKKVAYAVQLDGKDADGLKKLIERVEEAWDRGRNPFLTDDEYRTLKDLINYSDGIADDGRIVNRTKRAMVTKQSLERYRNEIRQGFENLNPNNKHSRALNRNEGLQQVVREFMSGNGLKIGKESAVVSFHNGVSSSADWNVWESSFGKTMNEIFGLKKGVKIFDPLSVVRANNASTLMLHKTTSGTISAPAALGSLLKLYKPDMDTTSWAHTSDFDSVMTAELTRHMWNNGEVNIKAGRKIYKEGTQLFSMTGLYRNEETPLDHILVPQADGTVKPRSYSNSVYRNRMHTVQKEFEYTFGGQKYYGMVMKNEDDGVLSVIARQSRRELQSTIQQNFMNMDAITKQKGLREQVLSYTATARATSEYESMFRGSSAYSNFTRYMTAHDIVSSNPELFTVTAGGRKQLNSNAFDALVKNGLTKVQAEKFMHMFERIDSESEILKAMRTQLGTLSNEDQQSTALWMFKNKMDATFNAHTTNIALPAKAYNQVKIWVPNAKNGGAWKHVDARDKSALANSLRSIATRSGNSRHGFLEAREKLRGLVSYMGHGGQYGDSILSKEQVSMLQGLMDRMEVPDAGFKGIGDMAAAVADIAFDRIHAVSSGNVIEGQESLARRTLSGDVNGFIGRLSDITSDASKYFTDNGTFSIHDERARTALSRIDEVIQAKASMVSSQVAGNRNLGPRAIFDAMSEMAAKYKGSGVSIDVHMSNAKGPGLELIFYASETATSVVNQHRDDATKLFIPLMDRDTGLFQVNGVQATNRFRPIKRHDGTIALETYQNKVFEVLGYKKTREEVASLIKHGKADQALALLKRNVEWSFHGVSSASMYGFDEMLKDRIGGSATSASLKELQLDIKDLVYMFSGKDKASRVPWENMDRGLKETIRSGILYNQSGLNSPKGKDPILDNVYDVLSRLGISLDVTGTKAESVTDGIFNIKNLGDARKFGIFGFWNDPGTDNIKAAQNYFELKRDFVPTAMTKSYFEGTKGIYANGATTHLNLNVAFMSDVDIAELAKQNNGTWNTVHPLERLTTHDDIMMMNKDTMAQFDAKIDHIEHLPEGANPSNWQDKIGKKIKPGDWIDANLEYKSKYEGTVKDIRLNEAKGIYEMIIEQDLAGKTGMKMQGIHAGNKFTVSGTGNIAEQLGVSANLDAVLNPKAMKRPGDALASQLNLIVHELGTVGKMSVADLRNSVEEFMGAALGHKRGSEALNQLMSNIQILENAGGKTLVMPDNITGTLHMQKAFDAAERLLNGKNVLAVIGKDTPQERKIYRGMMSTARINVFDTAEVTGADDRIVKMGFRELDVLRSRKYFINSDISSVIGAVQEKIYRNVDKYKSEGRQMFEAGLHASGKTLTNEEDYGIIRTRGEITGPNQIDFDDGKKISPFIRTEDGSYTKRHLEKTVLDPNLFDGKAFFLELPETVEMRQNINGHSRVQRVDKVLIPSLHTMESDGKAFIPEGIHGKIKQLYETVKEYRDNYNAGGDADKQELFFESQAKLQRVVSDYVTELGNAMHKSHGYLQENVFSSRMEHSGRFTYRAVNPLEGVEKYGDSMGKKLAEGHVFMSRQDFKGMLSGLGDADIDKIMTQAQGDGFAAIGIRYPSKDIDTSLPIMINIMGEEEEKKLMAKMGDFTGNIYATVGTQMRHNADHDGDTMSVVLAQLGGKKAGELNKQVDAQMKTWFNEEVRFNEKVAASRLENLDFTKDILVGNKEINGLSKEVQEALTSGLRSRVGYTAEGEDLADFVSKVEAKLQKEQVGRYSNLSVKVRRMAETVGSLTADAVGSQAWDPYIGLTYFLTASEQAPISAKKIGEQLQARYKANGNKLSETDITRFIGASEGLYDSISKLDGQAAVGYAKDLGFINDEGIFVGATKAEGERAKAIIGRYLTADDIVNQFDVLKKSFNNPNEWDSVLSLGMSGMTNPFQTMDFVNQIASGDSKYSFGQLEDVMRGMDLGDMVDQIQTNAKTAFSAHARLQNPLNAGAGSPLTRGVTVVTQTVGDEAMKHVASAAKEVLSNAGSNALGTTAAVAAGLFVVGSMFGSPTSREVEQPIPDQAPSSDGGWVNPALYAGAPMGAGPSARVMQRGSGYEKVNVKISGHSMSGMSNEEIAQVISEEVRRQAGIDVNMKITSEDNRTTVDKQWLQQQFADALETGYSH